MFTKLKKKIGNAVQFDTISGGTAEELLAIISKLEQNQKVRDHIDSVLPDETCEWKDVGEYWETGCEGAFCITAGTPKNNEMEYCPYCGKEIKVIK